MADGATLMFKYLNSHLKLSSHHTIQNVDKMSISEVNLFSETRKIKNPLKMLIEAGKKCHLPQWNKFCTDMYWKPPSKKKSITLKATLTE